MQQSSELLCEVSSRRRRCKLSWVQDCWTSCRQYSFVHSPVLWKVVHLGVWLSFHCMRRDMTWPGTQFHDHLPICYHHEPSRLPVLCDGCGATFRLQHDLDCVKGGLVKIGHNDLCDSNAKIADVAGEELGGVFLIITSLVPIHLHMRLWQTQPFIGEYKVPSSCSRGLWHFTVQVCSTDSVLHREYATYPEAVGKPSCLKVVGIIFSSHTQFVIFWSTNLELRGTCRRICGLGLQDGGGHQSCTHVLYFNQCLVNFNFLWELYTFPLQVYTSSEISF